MSKTTIHTPLSGAFNCTWICTVCNREYTSQHCAEVCPCLLGAFGDPKQYSTAKYCSYCNQWWHYLDYEKHLKSDLWKCKFEKEKETKMTIPKIESLQRSFDFEQRKTLKLKLKPADPEQPYSEISRVNDAIINSRVFLKDSTEYSRIEFRCGDFYYVVARLKKKE